MRTKSIVLVSLAVLFLPSLGPAEIVLLEDAAEIRSSNLQLPARAGGKVIFKQCSTCTASTAPTSSSSRYFVAGNEVSLSELRSALELVDENTDPVLTVLSDHESGYITRVIMD